MSDPRRTLPGVDRLLGSEAFGALLERWPRALLVEAVRGELDAARAGLAGDGGDEAAPDAAGWAARVRARLEASARPSLRRVVNATGVVLHTNLGRAPLADAARRAMAAAATGYSNLEYDVDAGARGSRYVHCAGLLARLTGAEAGLVVNNAAAALLLALNTVARGRRVLVSRGELVEIGGGFRIPEILERSGATLAEVGSTNRTRLEDYARALDDEGGAAILKVHRSNFSMRGFTEEAGLEELGRLARERGVALVHDLGSGLLHDPAGLGLPPEPRPAESVAAGADVTVFSGDKLLGGPQAGLAVGPAGRIAALRDNPLCRALRVDKVTLAGLEATLRLHLDPERARREVPALRMLAASDGELRERTERVVERLRAGGVDAAPGDGASTPGGGTYPELRLPGPVVRVRVPDPDAAARALRAAEPPVVARVEDDVLVADLRTVDPSEEDALVQALAALPRG